MSEMSTQPALICKRCGQPYSFTAHTTQADQEGTLLFKIMAEVAEDHLCADCKAKQSWYIQHGRQAEWEAGAA